FLHDRVVKRLRAEAGVVNDHAAVEQVFAQLGALGGGIGEMIVAGPEEDRVFLRVVADLREGADVHLEVRVRLRLHLLEQIVDVVRSGVPIDVRAVEVRAFLSACGLRREGQEQRNEEKQSRRQGAPQRTIKGGMSHGNLFASGSVYRDTLPSGNSS